MKYNSFLMILFLFIVLYFVCIKCMFGYFKEGATSRTEHDSRMDNIYASAGLINDYFSKESVERIEASLKAAEKSCASINEEIDVGSIVQLEPSQDDPYDQYLRDYILKIESGNVFNKKLKSIEKYYFENKYSPSVYKYLKDKRNYFIEQEKINRCKSLLKGVDFEWETSGNTIEDRLKYSYNTLVNITESIDMINKLKDINTKIIDEFQKKGVNDYSINSTNYRKTDYRNNENQKLYSINNILTFVYYILFGVLLLSLFVSQNLKIGSRFPIYIFLILLPIWIYPNLYYIIKNIYYYLKKKSEYHGPKNAFLDINIAEPKINVMDSYNN